MLPRTSEVVFPENIISKTERQKIAPPVTRVTRASQQIAGKAVGESGEMF